MMAGIVDSEERLLFCGATIISHKYVVTAAHCLDSRDVRELGIVVGEHDVTTGNH
jgi:secreted trypsin-like serine protease